MIKIQLSDKEFGLFSDLIYQKIGINLSIKKKFLLQSRLRKWLFLVHCDSYLELYKKIKNDSSGEKLINLTDAITTNVTSFFREESQWEYIRRDFDFLVDKKNKKIRIWSAACSTGQEPYSMAIFFYEYISDIHNWDIKILATDISKDALKKAVKGIYRKKDLKMLPKYYIKKYFKELKNDKKENEFYIIDSLKKLITFRIFNLVYGDYSLFKNRFDVIFLRNVMIYFDKKVQIKLINNITKLMHIDSYLFLGHSESILSENKNFKHMENSIYKLI